jgi:ABC-type branched-subunit amino acid transport system substrate-binding protein
MAGLRSSINAVNEAGGVHGKQIELMERDNASDLQRATTNFREIANSDALANHGNNLSNIIAALAPQADTVKIPMVNQTDVPQIMTPTPPEYVFSSEVPVTIWADLELAFAAELFEERGIDDPKIAIYTIETASADPYREAVIEGAEARGWTVVASESAAQTATDVTQQARAVVAAEPDAVVTYVVNITQAITAMNAQGLPTTVPIITQKQSGNNTNFEAIDQIGQEFYSLRSYVAPYLTDNPSVAQMQEDMKAAGQWKDELAGNEWVSHGYVEGLLIAQVLEDCGVDCTRDGYRDALANMKSLDTRGLTGVYGNSGDHRLVKEGQVYQWDPATSVPQPLDGNWITSS